MKDKLDILFSLVEKGKSLNYYGNPFEEMLYAFSSNKDAFMFLYESMPNDVKPNLIKCTNNFRGIFLRVIMNLDEQTFNNYFFAGMHELYDAEALRNLHFKLPNNTKLKAYWKTKESPKNIDAIVDLLFKLWSCNADSYPEMLEKYRSKLEKLSSITSQKSRAAEYFSNWVNMIIKKDGVQEFFKFCEEIKVEPISFCFYTNKNLGMDVCTMTQNDLKFLVDYGEKLINSEKHCPIKCSFQAVECACYCLHGEPKIINALQSLTNYNPDIEKISFIWSNQKEYIKYALKFLLSKVVYTEKNLSMSIPELVNKINKEAFKDTHWSSTLQLRKDEFNNMIQVATISELEKELPVNADSNKKKLKL
jgi:hypothetical protein